MNNKMIKYIVNNTYTIFNDEFDKWIRVPTSTVLILQIEKQISKNSLMSEKYIYLNMKSDSDVFFKKMQCYIPKEKINLVENNKQKNRIREYSKYDYRYII